MSEDIKAKVDSFMELMTTRRGIFRQNLDNQIKASAKYQSGGGDMDDIIRHAAEKVFQDAAQGSANFNQYELSEVVTLVSAELAGMGYGKERSGTGFTWPSSGGGSGRNVG